MFHVSDCWLPVAGWLLGWWGRAKRLEFKERLPALEVSSWTSSLVSIAIVMICLRFLNTHECSLVCILPNTSDRYALDQNDLEATHMHCQLTIVIAALSLYDSKESLR